MPKVTSTKSNFTAGEFSPLLLGRVDISKYFNGAKKLENFLIHNAGGALRRPGSKYVAEVKSFLNVDDAYTKLLLHCNGTDESTTFIDEVGKTVTAVGNAQIDTAQSKFGGASFYSPENGATYLSLADSADWYFGTGNFTVDFWVRFSDIGESHMLFYQGADDDNYWKIELNSSKEWRVAFRIGGVTKAFYGSTNPWNYSANIWYHIAVVRNGTSLLLFIDGASHTLTEVTAISTNDVGNVATVLQIGNFTEDGWMDEPRISKGIARWTANFPPPTEEYIGTPKAVRILPFQFSTDQAYILETGEYYFRFYTDQGQVQDTTHAITGATKANPCVITSANHPFQDGDDVVISGVAGMTQLNGNTYEVANKTATTYELKDTNSSAYGAYTSGGIATRSGALEIPTPYTESQLFDVQYAQSADVSYKVHSSHEVMKLERLSATSWRLTEVSFVRGPFLDANITATTIAPDADAGADVTLTASADTFEEGHIGSLWRIKSGVVKITAYTNAKVVIGDVQAEPDGTAGGLATGPGATDDWSEGAWSDVQGHPTSVTFHEGRLVFAKDQTIYASYSQSFENFAIGTNASDAFIYKIATEQVNAIRWMSSGPKALQVGTSGSTFSFSSGAEGVPITPTSIVVIRDTTYGVAAILPKRIGTFVYFVQRNLKTVRELGYGGIDIDSQQALDMTLLADHIAGDGIVDMAYQQSPNNMLWCVRSDGQMATLTRQIDQEVIGWSRQISGADSRGAGEYESVAVVPIDEGDDEVWIVVKRSISGSDVRYIEFFMPREFDAQHDAFFVDSGLTLDSPVVITGATAEDPVVITAAAHGFSDGDQVKIIDVVGMTELNNEPYLVANKNTNDFQLTTLAGADIDGTAFTAYISGGEVRKMVTAISGLSHLVGEAVAVCADGEARPNNIVSSAGAITLASKAAVVHVGLPYTSTIQGLSLTDGSPTGLGAGKTRRIHEAIIRFYRTLGVQFGSEDDQDSIDFVPPALPTGEITPLFTGIKPFDPPTGWDRLGEFYLIQSQPLPVTVLYVVLLSEVNE